MGQRGTKPVENLGHRITDLPGLPEEPPREICGDDYACEAWERFVPALNMLGHVCILNLPDVLTVCQAYSLARTAWEDLAEDGRLVVEGESSSYENPLFRVWVTANARMEKCLKKSRPVTIPPDDYPIRAAEKGFAEYRQGVVKDLEKVIRENTR